MEIPFSSDDTKEYYCKLTKLMSFNTSSTVKNTVGQDRVHGEDPSTVIVINHAMVLVLTKLNIINSLNQSENK